LALAFRQAGYQVVEASTPWLIGADERGLLEALAGGFANAVAEIGRVPPGVIDDWRPVRRDGCVVGHTDTLALPPG
jgi:hypothetical protein